MKKLVVCALAAVVACAVLAEESAASPKGKKKKGLPTGGFIELVNTGSVIQVVNAQTRFGADAVNQAVAEFRKEFGFAVKVMDSPVDGPIGQKVAARVSLVDKEGVPALLCAPEEGWSQVNVHALSADSPAEIVLHKRIIKELWRGLCYALGCGNSIAQPCVMSEVRTLKDLDETSRAVGPESSGKVLHTGRNRGATPTRFASYRTACIEGWAPAPTNDVQKAIWEQTKALQSLSPTKGIKIQYDPKKGK